MRKIVLCFGTLISLFLLLSCSGNSNKQAGVPATMAELQKAKEVISYYSTSLEVLKNLVNEKEINALLDYMNLKGKAPALPTIVEPMISPKDSAILMKPDSCFNAATRRNLTQNYAGLFNTRNEFYMNFDAYQNFMKEKNVTEADKLLQANYQLSIEMSEYKQNIYDILTPFTEQAEQVILAENPLKEHIVAIGKMSGEVQNIINLYAGRHAMRDARINDDVAKLTKELELAKKLPAVPGHEKEMKDYNHFLTQVEAFLKVLPQVRANGAYSESGYDMLINSYGLSLD